MLIICQIDWREVGVAFELQCLRNCTLSSFILYCQVARWPADLRVAAEDAVAMANCAPNLNFVRPFRDKKIDEWQCVMPLYGMGQTNVQLFKFSPNSFEYFGMIFVWIFFIHIYGILGSKISCVVDRLSQSHKSDSRNTRWAKVNVHSAWLWLGDLSFSMRNDSPWSVICCPFSVSTYR